MPDSPSERGRQAGDIVLYQTEDGRNRIQVRLENETVWLTQALMAELFQTSVPNISIHIRNILAEGELRDGSVVKEYLITATDGKRYRTKHYSLEMILAVGYRVRSPRGTQFRQWATERLGEYLVKGFTLDDERLKGRDQVGDYFDELLARIREIRASEKRVYQRIREIFALAVDYREGEQETQFFFATMQNKMHFAATGMTAAEIVRRRADADQPNMGLMTWTGGRVIKRDVATAKNYLNEGEIDTLNRIVVMFLDQAEFRAQRRRDIRMRDWTLFLDKFLRDTELPVLEGVGTVSQDEARSWAELQYDSFAEHRRLAEEKVGGERYVEDLRASAKALEAGRTPPAPARRQRQSRRGGDKRTEGDQP